MLPKGWSKLPLGKIAQVTSGGTPNRANPAYWGGDIPWVTTGEVHFNKITDTVEKITEQGLISSSAKLFPAGTLLMAMYGQGKTRGQMARLGISAATNQACAAICLRDDHDSDFFFHLLSSKYDSLRKLSNDGAQQNLSGGIIKQFIVTVPSALEQHAIARVFDCWDEAIAATERLLANSRKQFNFIRRSLIFGNNASSIWREEKIGALICENNRRFDWDDNAKYPLISIRRRSEGAFHRETLLGHEILTKKLKLVNAGDFVISKMQIVHGAMASIPRELDGMYASDSYLVYESKVPETLEIRFLAWLSTTAEFRRLAYRCSHGVHIEKMTFDVNSFLSERVRIPPSLGEQMYICNILDKAAEIPLLLKKHLVNLRMEKSALMQQILPGKRRVQVPKQTEATLT